jgi:hypothetical protein
MKTAAKLKHLDRPRGVLLLLRSLLILLTLLPTPGLIFPQRRLEYDGAQNNISMEEINRLGEFQGEVATGLLASPISPHHFLTAGHADVRESIRFAGRMYTAISEIRKADHDLKIVVVRETIPFYLKVQPTNVSFGALLRVYGKSGVPEAPPIVVDDEVKGWRVKFRNPPGPNTNWRPRWGTFKVTYLDPIAIGFRWDAANEDCPIFAIGDSGGGVFFQKRLTGLVTSAYPSPPFRTKKTGPDEMGFIFDYTGLYDSFGLPATERMLTDTQVMNLVGFRPWILNVISPPLKIVYGATIPGWTSVAAPQIANAQDLSRPASVEDILGLTAAYVENDAKGRIVYTATDLLRTESYNVRLHFSNAHFKKPGQVLQKITINGKVLARHIDPIKEGNLHTMDFTGMISDKNNHLQIVVQPDGSKNATLSGLELFIPEVPAERP